jgi:hypothetical protein
VIRPFRAPSCSITPYRYCKAISVLVALLVLGLPGICASARASSQPGFPIRAAFYYPWFPEAWKQGGHFPFTKYSPSLGYYDLGRSRAIQSHVRAMRFGHIDAAISSWWGRRHRTDRRLGKLLSTTAGMRSSLRWSIYYEQESLSDPAPGEISRDLRYIRNRYGRRPAYLRINGRFVVFVYADGSDGCQMARRWKEANRHAGAYLVLKVFPGYRGCPSRPQSWHQYAPAAATDSQGGYSYAVSPGFHKSGESSARLPRDLGRWRRNVRTMAASKARFQLVTTFNEWGEGTAVESAAQWGSSSGYGDYLDALHAHP